MAEVFGLLERKHLGEQVGKQAWAAYTQILVESFKHAFADRAAWLGDPAFVDVPVARLISGPYLDGLAKQIQFGRTFAPEFYGSRPEPAPDPADPPHDHGTSHLSIIDLRPGKRMAVACTETINLHFGSLVSSDQLGFCLNDEMDDFTTRWDKDGAAAANAFNLVQSERNRPQPGKRPLSSMSPTIVLDKDGRVEAVAGGSGGPRIITATVQVLLNTLLRGDDAWAAVSRKRIHHQWKPNELELEPGFDERQTGLGVDMWMRKQHHQVVESKPTETACVQLIVRKQGKLDAACDPRKGGAPAGE
jgi:gamma-glutamyltranspeptidase/glutathione hydrolase